MAEKNDGSRFYYKYTSILRALGTDAFTTAESFRSLCSTASQFVCNRIAVNGHQVLGKTDWVVKLKLKTYKRSHRRCGAQLYSKRFLLRAESLSDVIIGISNLLFACFTKKRDDRVKDRKLTIQ
jgi:hypothetical protein